MNLYDVKIKTMINQRYEENNESPPLHNDVGIQANFKFDERILKELPKMNGKNQPVTLTKTTNIIPKKQIEIEPNPIAERRKRQKKLRKILLQQIEEKRSIIDFKFQLGRNRKSLRLKKNEL